MLLFVLLAWSRFNLICEFGWFVVYGGYMHLLAPSRWSLIIVETALWNGLLPVTGTVCYLPGKVSDNGAHRFCCFLSFLSLTNQTPLDLSFSLTQDQLW